MILWFPQEYCERYMKTRWQRIDHSVGYTSLVVLGIWVCTILDHNSRWLSSWNFSIAQIERARRELQNDPKKCIKIPHLSKVMIHSCATQNAKYYESSVRRFTIFPRGYPKYLIRGGRLVFIRPIVRLPFLTPVTPDNIPGGRH